MSTGKTNTLAEKEKSECVHEQGTKVEKTKGDDIGKENSEDRNERGTEAKNTKDGGEEKQREIEKGNAEDRGKKKSENQNKKGEKADKTKGNKRDVVVQTKYGQVAERAVMESLYANIEIFGEVLDTWSDLINHQELESDFENSPYRLFLKVGVSISLCFNLNSFLIHK
uniref:Uncharacterized protein n=1 Tax=Lactuca sativa TaxID=4236 RepID=A0A9R1UX69_LACSA|nr:hypothetical protein LSAT_V11C700381260 [Lactuca sativa]